MYSTCRIISMIMMFLKSRVSPAHIHVQYSCCCDALSFNSLLTYWMIDFDECVFMSSFFLEATESYSRWNSFYGVCKSQQLCRQAQTKTELKVIGHRKNFSNYEPLDGGQQISSLTRLPPWAEIENSFSVLFRIVFNLWLNTFFKYFCQNCRISTIITIDLFFGVHICLSSVIS